MTHDAITAPLPKRFLAICALTLAATGCAYDVEPYRAPASQILVVDTLDLPEQSGDAATRATTRFIPTTLPAPDPPERKIGLNEIRALALANNLDLRVVRYDPLIANENLNAEEAAFEALFVVDGGLNDLNQPTASELVGARIRDVSVTPGIAVPLRTGGDVAFDVPLGRNETNNEFATLNPAYTADARLTISQPLLRGFGPDAAEYGIRVATASLGQAQARQKLQVVNVLAIAERAYWNYYAAAEATRVFRQQYDIAVQSYERARRQFEAGAEAEVETLRFASDVADALQALIQAEETQRAAQRELKRIINAPDLEVGGPTEIVPDTPATATYYQTDTAALVRAALTRRMELLQNELQVAIEYANVLLRRNDRLPRLDVNYQFALNGLGEGFDDAFGQVGDGDSVDNRFGLNVEVPLGNRQRRSRLRAALLSRMQELARREQLQLQVKQEVLDAADFLRTAWQRILAARRRVVLAQRLLDAELRQFDLDLNTALEVTQARANLADAQLAEVRATSDYEVARVDLAVATGTVIGKGRVVLDVPLDDRGRY